MNVRVRWTRIIALVLLALAVIAVGVFGFTLVTNPVESMAQQQSRFMGGNPSVEDSEDVNTLRLLFPAGSRSNWHTHTDGQLLMIEEGRGRTQVRGQALEVMQPGEPWWTDAGVEHWHGAGLEEDALQLTIYSGTVNWLEPVSNDVYTARPGG